VPGATAATAASVLPTHELMLVGPGSRVFGGRRSGSSAVTIFEPLRPNERWIEEVPFAYTFSCACLTEETMSGEKLSSTARSCPDDGDLVRRG